jgi:N6-adenosine-specific RNA methylase IME4
LRRWRRDSLVTWQGILIDGHHRYKICTEHNIKFETTEADLSDRHAVINWMIANQLGRRNLSGMQQKRLWAKRYKQEVKAVGFNQHSEGIGNSYTLNGKTAERLGGEYGVHADTINQAVRIDNALDTLEDLTSPEIVNEITSKQGLRLKGNRKITEGDVIAIAKIHEKEPEIAKTVIDEMLAGNAKTVKQGAVYARRVERQHKAQQLPNTVFNVIYADPPWQYSNTGLEGSAEGHYPTMHIDDICDLLNTEQVQIVDNAALFLWVTNPLLEDGFKVINSWGFNYKSGLVWVKPYQNQGKSGWYAQTHHEYLLIAVKGKCLPHYQPQSVISAERSAHSAKPEVFREIIERMYPDYNYLELFARRQEPRDNWVFWGNEA